MTIAFWCVFIAGVMPMVWAFVAKTGPGADFKNYDNNAPRRYLSDVTGLAQRANWAQQNSWEAFAPFAAAVIIAAHVGLKAYCVDYLAMTFVFARLGYGISYILDRPYWRSAMWFLGFLSVVMLYVFSATKVA